MLEIKKIDLDAITDDNSVEIFHALLGLEGIKFTMKLDNLETLWDLFLREKLPSGEVRKFCAQFLGIPWELSELEDDDVEILQQMHEILSI